MKIFKKEIEIQTSKIFELVKLTDKIQKIIEESSVDNGFLLVRSLHTTAAVTVTENDQALHHDLKMVMEKTLSLNWGWQHIGEGVVNARAHQIAILIGNSAWAPIIEGQISLGTWQDIFFVECLQARLRRVEVVVIALNTKGVKGDTP